MTPDSIHTSLIPWDFDTFLPPIMVQLPYGVAVVEPIATAVCEKTGTPAVVCATETVISPLASYTNLVVMAPALGCGHYTCGAKPMRVCLN